MEIDAAYIDGMVARGAHYDTVRDTLDAYVKDNEPGFFAKHFKDAEAPSYSSGPSYFVQRAVITTDDTGMHEALLKEFDTAYRRDSHSNCATVELDGTYAGKPTHTDTQRLSEVAEVAKNYLKGMDSFSPDIPYQRALIEYGDNESLEEAAAGFADAGINARIDPYSHKDGGMLLIGMK
ncbi:MAG: hypothetical protein QGG26_06230 [Candidatus Undinarchaeales archaeon]|jgi:hypothetical protein|nr:hypothetical protein [Candidatus Undinarchaeales archaeon]